MGQVAWGKCVREAADGRTDIMTFSKIKLNVAGSGIGSAKDTLSKLRYLQG